MTQELWYLLIVVLVMIIVIIIVVLIMTVTKNRIIAANNEQLDRLQQTSSNALNNFSMQLAALLRNDIDNLTDNTYHQLDVMKQQMGTNLSENQQRISETFQQTLVQLTKITAVQSQLDSVFSQLNGLHRLFADKKSRGAYGEIELYTLLQMAYGDDQHFWQPQYRLSNGTIADAVVLGQGSFDMVVIDSKFPLENYQRMMDDSISKADQQSAEKAFINDVSTQIKDIAAKYIIAGQTASFAYMFIPAEAIFAQIYGHYDKIISLSYQYHVFIVSPTTLMAYLTAFKTINLNQQRSQQDAQLQIELNKLSRQFELFTQRWGTVVSDIEKTGNDIQQLDVTNGKMIQRFNRIAAVRLDSAEESYEQEKNN